MVVIRLPSEVRFIIDRLKTNGYDAYVVGGCVRDSLIGLNPHDWDICTAALPEQMIEVFSDCRIVPTGLKHGTISIIIDDVAYEVTTFRIDGEYQDNRHPMSVEFVSDLKLDLLRRDFTINAMAYNDDVGLVDLFNGQNHIRHGIIKCVGNADERFNEDALRIMRAIRFAARFGFNIEEDTYKSMIANMSLLKNISIERVCSELTKTLDNGIFSIDNSILISTLIDCIKTTIQYDMKYSGSIFKRIINSEKSLEIRLAILFDYPEITNILRELRFSNDIINIATDIHRIGHMIHNDKNIWMSTESISYMRLLVKCQVDGVDFYGYPYYARKILHEIKYCSVHEAIEFAKSLSNEDTQYLSLLENQAIYCIEHNDVVSISCLEVNGNDLMNLGIKGKDIGVILNKLLELVMSDGIKNNKSDLLEVAKSLSP